MPWTQIKSLETAGQGASSSGRILTYKDAIREAHTQTLEKYAECYVIGEGINDAGAIFGTTKGLVESFGSKRVLDVPISEEAFTGMALGSAVVGMRPVVVHQRDDFMMMAMDQIVNHVAKWNYMHGNQLSISLVMRAIIGRGWGSAAQHSQSLQALFAHIPGLQVVMPTTPYDAKGLLIAAIESNQPVIMLEHRWLYERVGYVPEEYYALPFGKGRVLREGTDATIISFSYMTIEALKAADILANEGYSIEVFDPLSIVPMDMQGILTSLKKTGRVIIADTGHRTCGVSAEVSARIMEEGFEYLKAPVKRITLPDHPTPASSHLEQLYYPGSEEIAKAVKGVLG